MNRRNRTRVLLFVKSPRKGFVKTRLGAVLDPESVVALYKCFVADILDMLAKTPYPVTVCYHPADAGPEVTAWLGDDIPCLPQYGNTLGAKMAAAFQTAFAAGCRKVVLIGSDLPDLPSDILHRAFRNLDRRDMILGPAGDGGYYLAGFNHNTFSPALFQAVEWGTPAVLRKTLILAGRHSRSIHLLPEWRDMDTCEDLRNLMRTDSAGASITREFLRSSRLIDQNGCAMV